MHLSTFKSLNRKTILGGGILCIVLTLFLTSCENFLKAADIKDEIEKVIEYNNAQKVPVLIRAIDGTGSFLVDGEKYFTVNYSEEEVQFTENKNGCIFLGLEAVCKTDPSISREDCVEIKTISKDSINGVYTYSVKVIKKVNDILIRPKCILRPAVIQYGPLDTEYSSEPITIKFNTPLQDASVSQDNCVLDFSNISIKCNNTYIGNYFDNPVLNEDKTVLYIYPKCEEFNEFLDSYYNNSIPTVEITVSLDSRTAFNINGYSVQFADNNNLTFTSRYSTKVETDNPSIRKFGIYKKWDENTTIPSNTNMFHDYNTKHFTYNFEKDDNNQDTSYLKYYFDNDYSIVKNRTKGTVYIYGEGYDGDGSGVRIVKVNEQFVPAYYSYLSDEDSWNMSVNYTKDSPEVVFWNTDDSGRTTFCIKHEIRHHDCTVQLETTVYDACGNPSATKYYTLIKLTKLSFEMAQLKNVHFSYDYYSTKEYQFSRETFSAALRNVKLIYHPEDEDDTEYDDLLLEDETFAACLCDRQIDPSAIYKTIECRYIDDEGTPQKLPMKPFVYEEDKYKGAKNWNCDIVNVENLNDLTVTIYIEDDLGNSATQDFTFSSTPLITNVDDDGDSKTVEWIKGSSQSPSNMLLFWKESDDTEDNDTVETWNVQYFDDDFTINKGYDYYFIALDDQFFLASDLSPKYTYNSNFSTPDSNVTFTSAPVMSSSGEEGKTNVTVKIPQNAWDNFENIFIKAISTISYFEKNATELTFAYDTTSLFENDVRIDLYGENNGICGQLDYRSVHLDKNEASDRKYDTVPPYLHYGDSYGSHDLRTINYYIIEVKDDETGIKSVTFNGKPCYVSAGEVILNMYDCIDYTAKIPSYNIKLVVTDVAGNRTEVFINDRINIKDAPEVNYKTNDSNGKWIFYSPIRSTLVTKLESNSSGYYWGTGWYNEGSLTKEIAYSGISNMFIRVMSETSPATYYYTGLKKDSNNNYIFSNSGSYDFLLPNGSSKDSVIISSDAPVLVHTLVSTYPYDICKNWNVDDWEFYKKEVGLTQINFTEKDQKKYKIPVDEINKYECYVVIAHFADGTSVMSEVMVM